MKVHLKFCICLIVLIVCVGSINSQTLDEQSSSLNCNCPRISDNDDVLLTVAGEDITSSYFMYIYNKNNKDKKWSVNEYLELFINFQLKVFYAKEKGIDKTDKFINEWTSYCESARDSFIIDEALLESMTRIAYQRNMNIRRVAHIAVRCPETASAEEVAKAMMKISEARSRIVEYGERFSDVALKYSDDPNVKESKGELGWITQFRYIYSLAESVYSTPVGKISPVCRTPFGFHIVLVEEELPNVFAHAAHIMKYSSNENAKQEIGNIYLQLFHGGNFEDVAAENSDDKQSAARGGDLGFFNRGMMVKDFEDVVFSMKPGDVSKPFETQYGWHIVKLYETKQYGSYTYEEERKSLRSEVKRDQDMLMIVAGPYIKEIRERCKFESSVPDKEVLAYIRQNLKELNRDYANLCQEYYDGILLFEGSLDSVWSKAKTKEEQDRIEKEWLKDMRGKYNVRVNEESLKRLKKMVLK